MTDRENATPSAFPLPIFARKKNLRGFWWVFFPDFVINYTIMRMRSTDQSPVCRIVSSPSSSSSCSSSPSSSSPSSPSTYFFFQMLFNLFPDKLQSSSPLSIFFFLQPPSCSCFFLLAPSFSLYLGKKATYIF